MARVVIGWRDRVQAGAVTAGSQEATLPAANVQNDLLSRPWRSLEGDDATHLLVDFGVVRGIGWIALSNCNLTSAGTVRVRGSNADATAQTNLVYDQGTVAGLVLPDWRRALVLLPTDLSFRYLRVNLSDPSLEYLEVGRLQAGPLFRPSYNFTAGLEWLLDDPSDKKPTEGGSTFTYERQVVRGLSFVLPAVTQAERDAHLEPMQRLSGVTNDIMVCREPAASDLGRETIIGPPNAVIGIRHDGFNRYTGTFNVSDRQ